jgi:hypothetical protein
LLAEAFADFSIFMWNFSISGLFSFSDFNFPSLFLPSKLHSGGNEEEIEIR